ncbi:hypothetical protein WQE_15281 [Paraburkholderia hospita]|uniref:Uncharacterized protein n=1 Tax=Paraburkholderia hospita TaxID=169430 RepID=A0ABP2PSD8_9BURK|nr:hypothetical protein [Paraburkholderia hospita]EIN00405.1 hypothetical protein WQE_15281 [Paraburkholderia hospita]OUL88417.1 hypothetical protein CA602_11180 [Paraburkholderia hospita]
MKVAELLSRLVDADPEAIVLLLPSYGDYPDAEELREVALMAETWTCERQHELDGTTRDVHYPAGREHAYGWNPQTDESWSERVVVLSPLVKSSFDGPPGESGTLSDGPFSIATLREQALQAQREMVSDGTLILENEFRERLGVSKKRLAQMLEDGSIFAVNVENTVYYPSVLVDARYDRTRLQEICRIIVPGGDSRLDLLTTRRESLGDKSPLEMLNDDGNYALLRRMAEAWAAEFSRTIVKLFDGTLEAEPSNVEATYTAMTEIDPRKPVWERASAALHEHGYEWPLGPYPEVRAFTAFVEREHGSRWTVLQRK